MVEGEGPLACGLAVIPEAFLRWPYSTDSRLNRLARRSVPGEAAPILALGPAASSPRRFPFHGFVLSVSGVFKALAEKLNSPF